MIRDGHAPSRADGIECDRFARLGGELNSQADRGGIQCPVWEWEVAYWVFIGSCARAAGALQQAHARGKVPSAVTRGAARRSCAAPNAQLHPSSLPSAQPWYHMSYGQCLRVSQTRHKYNRRVRRCIDEPLPFGYLITSEKITNKASPERTFPALSCLGIHRPPRLRQAPG